MLHFSRWLKGKNTIMDITVINMDHSHMDHSYIVAINAMALKLDD
jgi:hypothetical protein